MMTTNLFVIANVKQLWTGGSFRILLPFFRTPWGVGILNPAIFNSFHNRVEFGTILEGLRNFRGGVFEHTHTPSIRHCFGQSSLLHFAMLQDLIIPNISTSNQMQYPHRMTSIRSLWALVREVEAIWTLCQWLMVVQLKTAVWSPKIRMTSTYQSLGAANQTQNIRPCRTIPSSQSILYPRQQAKWHHLTRIRCPWKILREIVMTQMKLQWKTITITTTTIIIILMSPTTTTSTIHQPSNWWRYTAYQYQHCLVSVKDWLHLYWTRTSQHLIVQISPWHFSSRPLTKRLHVL